MKTFSTRAKAIERQTIVQRKEREKENEKRQQKGKNKKPEWYSFL